MLTAHRKARRFGGIAPEPDLNTRHHRRQQQLPDEYSQQPPAQYVLSRKDWFSPGRASGRGPRKGSAVIAPAAPHAFRLGHGRHKTYKKAVEPSPKKPGHLILYRASPHIPNGT